MSTQHDDQKAVEKFDIISHLLDEFDAELVDDNYLLANEDDVAAWDDDDDFRFEREESLFTKAHRDDPAGDAYSHKVPLAMWNQITENLFCGGDDYLHNNAVLRQLQREGVTHVLDCRTSWEVRQSYGAPDFSHANSVFEIETNCTGDDGQDKADEYFYAAMRWAEEVLRKQPDAKLYVHCAMGINRGPSNLLAIMHGSLGYDLEHAMRTIRASRPGAGMVYWPNVQRAVKQRMNPVGRTPVVSND